ncbi:hypothetical protein HNP37_001118 [Flavobacterium nitrogenifigens]|uniref:DUF6850 domain-containing protein n=2 Tax=Flavobacterium TaxID=237 RepID=A0A7W7N740_9FLAO|nr:MULTISPECIES: DUF6850 family outer membrane beta-barrel protein [Flavobacterium]MBB4801079.1 hypothetical protein [Flavobacterium nitrogenifigens]MBB6385173.1 hypothetical protein [Flavobacterium notoginsengisoli]
MKINKIKINDMKSNAWKNWALLLLLFSFVFNVNAQDTIKVQNHIIDNQIKNQIFKYPIVYTNPNIKDFTFTEVSYEHQQNEFARKQVANEINTYQFSAQGYFTTKSKWKLFGDLAIKKILEKNLGWVLSDDRSEEQEVITPHYFYVPRKADWDNQTYALSGGFSKDITNHLSVAIKANYGAEKYNRIADPRPQITNRKMGGEIQIGYQITENHKAFILGNYTENKKDYTYSYSNPNLNFEAFPETYLRFNAGYGRVLNYFKSIEKTSIYNYRDLRDKVGLGYTFSNKKTIITALFYKQNSNNVFYPSSYTLKETERLKLKTNSNHAEIFGMYRWNKKEIQSTLQFDQSEARNFDKQSNGYNYTNLLNKLNWTASLSKKTGSKIDYLFGLNMLYQQNEYDDILATAHIELNSLNTGIYTSKDFAFAKSKLNTTVSFNMYFPLPSKLEYYDTSGGTNARFFDEVIIHDYAVSTTNYFAPGLRLQYSYPTKNKKTVVFFTDLKEKIALKKQTDYPVSINTNTTYWVQMGVQLNY